MEPLLDELRALLTGEMHTDTVSRHTYSHDASMFELVPEAIVYPHDAKDVQTLIRFVNAKKQAYPTLSITPRSAGTDVSGGAIGTSLVLDMTKHFNAVETTSSTVLRAQPGASLRTIEPLLAAYGAMIGCAPASHAKSTLGGMIANNSAGEQSLRYGNADKSVQELTVVLADGNTYILKPITKRELTVKMKRNDFEGTFYRRMYELIEKNYDLIKNARPRTSKNSMGYNLWSVWDRDTGIFDLTQLFTGSQGTLGIITDVTLGVVPKAKHSGVLFVYLDTVSQLDAIIPLVTSHNPATFEGFDARHASH
jgi:FAD/FMN-containing dehydrogenase